jgi:uncharacterized protein YprB with RNaseH-like and TPR domain
MIERTFRIIPSVGPRKEKGIWDAGIMSWSDFLSSERVPGIPCGSKSVCDSVLETASVFLSEGDGRSLGGMLPRGEQWRLYGRFADRAAFLDIETDGLARDSLVTVVTVQGPGGTATLVNGRDLDSDCLSSALRGAQLLVTFNGSCFDVPVLRNSFPDADLGLPHYDLRFACRKVGYRGGLKTIERQMGITRPEGIEEVDGMEAVRLWRRWERSGDRGALETLLEYNRADTLDLRPIADTVYDKLVREHAGFCYAD